MKKLLRYMKGYRKECLLGPFFKLTEAVFELFVPLVVVAIIDNGIGSGDTGYVLRRCLLMGGLALLGLICAVTAQYFAARAATGFAAKLRSALFSHIQSLSYTKLDTLGTSTLVTRMTSDINQVQTGVNLTLRLLLRSPFIVFGAMIMAFTIDVPSALIFAVVIPILAVVVFAVMLACIPLYKKVQGALDKVLGKTRENLTGARVVRAFGEEENEIAGFNERNDSLTSIQKLVGRISALMNPMTFAIINIATILLINKGALRVDSGDMTQGQVVAMYNYMAQILVELIKLANLIITITKSLACAKRVESVFEISGGEGSCADVIRSDESLAVEFDNVSLSYETGGDEVLTGISFAVPKGQTVGIIGGTGSGKTSLVNLIPGFYRATVGTVFVNGQNVGSQDASLLRKSIGIVPQKAVLFSGTIRENMLWGNENADDEMITEAIRAAQGLDILDVKGGLDAQVEQNGRNLSGGQRQRLTIARALVRKPDILILDDSASALDFATDAALRKALRSLDYSPTVFIVSQRTSSIMHADKIIVLDDGEAVGIGTHSELLESCDVYKEIYDSQFRKEAC